MQEHIERKNEYAKQVLIARNYHVATHNGQRISVNQQVDERRVARLWNEVYIGALPRDSFEDDLLPLLEKAGTVYKIRYMLDFSGTCRGFSFVKYTTPEEAAYACQLLDKFKIRPDRPPIGVKMSFDNKCLYFGSLPYDCTSEKLISLLRMADVQGIVSAKMSPKTDKTRARFAHVTFESHQAATQARRLLMPADCRLFDCKITIDWAKAKPPELNSILKEAAIWSEIRQVITLYNVDTNRIPLDVLKRIFELNGQFKILDIGLIASDNEPPQVTIKYSNVEGANMMLDAIAISPNSFSRLCLPNTMLVAL